eukprot:CAMPEP_0179405396 /NCGR_PEP_ID=MMETSP0799-20121207/256_1 /TAXON_ID=46947 /ORGANISM="Geminigera cryophila, Strain CCMP2564" /LENGTH=170 /DNA_ID=CAMNT_0021176225 /DNA_START=1098 /DNA_END=1611 /DNA_ORIENTATION=-
MSAIEESLQHQTLIDTSHPLPTQSAPPSVSTPPLPPPASASPAALPPVAPVGKATEDVVSVLLHVLRLVAVFSTAGSLAIALDGITRAEVVGTRLVEVLRSRTPPITLCLGGRVRTVGHAQRGHSAIFIELGSGTLVSGALEVIILACQLLRTPKLLALAMLEVIVFEVE